MLPSDACLLGLDKTEKNLFNLIIFKISLKIKERIKKVKPQCLGSGSEYLGYLDPDPDSREKKLVALTTQI